MPSLFVYQGPDQGALFELEEGSQGIGRDSNNAFQIHDREASLRHAEVSYDGVSCLVTDLNTSNGTHVNGHRILQPCRLSSADRVQIGGTLMLFTDPEENPPTEPAGWIVPWMQTFCW
jgi:pSer/pThr/pTyr-binding forkhead associated (FHA) protein